MRGTPQQQPQALPATPRPLGMACILISLRRTPERTRAALQELASVGLPVTVLWASDGSDAAFISEAPLAPDCRLQAGEIGLLASWHRAAAMIVRQNLAGALVFEDDAEAVRPGTLDAVQELPADVDFALLHDAHIPIPTECGHGHTETFLRVQHCSWQTVAVYLSNAGARKMLIGLLPYRQASDVFLRDNEVGLVGFQCRPGKGLWRQSFMHPSLVRENHLAGNIPKIIHRIWIGETMPSEFRAYGEAWRALHPDWEYRLWSGCEIEREFPEALTAKTPAEQSDIARLLILQKYGGLYADTDFEPLRNFDPLVSSAAFLFGWMDEKSAVNGLLASVPGHPIINACVALCRSRMGAGGTILWRSGPAMLQDALEQWLTAFPKPCTHQGQSIGTAYGDTGLVGLAPSVLFPYLWTQPRPETYPPTAWAAHHWARSWWTPADWDAFNSQTRNQY